jgi:hypothetical protein
MNSKRGTTANKKRRDAPGITAVKSTAARERKLATLPMKDIFPTCYQSYTSLKLANRRHLDRLEPLYLLAENAQSLADSYKIMESKDLYVLYLIDIRMTTNFLVHNLLNNEEL